MTTDNELLNKLVRYSTLGVSVSIIAYLISGKRFKTEEMLLLAIATSFILALVDYYLPSTALLKMEPDVATL